MTNLLKSQIITILENLTFKNGHKLIEHMSEIVIQNNNIGFSIDISGKTLQEGEALKSIAIKLLKGLKDINKITISLTNELNVKKVIKFQEIPGVKNIVIVVAGKGGVGKSTIAAAIAQKLAKNGLKIGIVDADIYGPSIPAIFGLKSKIETYNNHFVPHRALGIQIMSIGFLVDPDAALAWRGPMVNKILHQLLMQTKWDQLDYLIIDMPPGTGDIHLSLAENYRIMGALIVTSPWQLSVNDVSKAIDLLNIFKISIFGIIENFSIHNDFTNNLTGGEYLAKKYNLPLICKIPNSNAIAKACDEGFELCNLVNIPLKFLQA